jgi:uncharacterized membrane protein YdbT with pleckstrin-like domain
VEASSTAEASGTMTVRVSKTKFWYWLLGYPAWKKRTWTATPTGIVARYGILSRNETRIPWQRITDKSIHQSVFGRIFNYGTIELETAGDAGSSMVLDRVGNVESFYDVLCEHTDSVRPGDGT